MRYRLGNIVSHIIFTIFQIVVLVLLNKIPWFHNNLFIFIIISATINIFIFVQYHSIAQNNDARFGKKSSKPKQIYRSTTPSPQIEDNTIEFMDKNLFYNNTAIADYKDGNVYCKEGGNRYLIGHYKIEVDKVIVKAKDGREIGVVALNNGIPNLIHLSNIGWYKHMGLSDYSQKPMSMLAAEIYFSEERRNQLQVILDISSSDTIAVYRGDPIGAASAFVCLLYECSQSGKYHQFYYS